MFFIDLLIAIFLINDEAYEAYQQAFEELKTLESNYCESAVTLVVAKLEDCFEAVT